PRVQAREEKADADQARAPADRRAARNGRDSQLHAASPGFGDLCKMTPAALTVPWSATAPGVSTFPSSPYFTSCTPLHFRTQPVRTRPRALLHESSLLFGGIGQSSARHGNGLEGLANHLRSRLGVGAILGSFQDQPVREHGSGGLLHVVGNDVLAARKKSRRTCGAQERQGPA